MTLKTLVITSVLYALVGGTGADTASGENGAKAPVNPDPRPERHVQSDEKAKQSHVAPTGRRDGKDKDGPGRRGVLDVRPRLENASIEFGYLRGLRNASIEFGYLRGLRNTSIELGYLRGLRNATIEFDLFTEGREIEVPEESLGFGAHAQCASLVLAVPVTNIGYAPTTVLDLVLVPDLDEFTVLTAGPFELTQGQSQDVVVQFAALAPGPVGGTLQIHWIDDDDSTVIVTVSLTGEGTNELDDCDDDDVCTVDVCDPSNQRGGKDGCVHTYDPRPYGDVTPFGSLVPPCPADPQGELGDGFANMLDVFCAFNAFNEGFPYTECPCADVAPCGGDSFVNMQDVFSIFSAFNDSPACPDPCP